MRPPIGRLYVDCYKLQNDTKNTVIAQVWSTNCLLVLTGLLWVWAPKVPWAFLWFPFISGYEKNVCQFGELLHVYLIILIFAILLHSQKLIPAKIRDWYPRGGSRNMERVGWFVKKNCEEGPRRSIVSGCYLKPAFIFFFAKPYRFYYYFVANEGHKLLKACRVRSPGTPGFTFHPLGSVYQLIFSGQSWVNSLEKSFSLWWIVEYPP